MHQSHCPTSVPLQHPVLVLGPVENDNPVTDVYYDAVENDNPVTERLKEALDAIEVLQQQVQGLTRRLEDHILDQKKDDFSSNLVFSSIESMKEENDANHRFLEIQISAASKDRTKLRVELENHKAAIHNKMDTATSKIRALENANLEEIKKNANLPKDDSNSNLVSSSIKSMKEENDANHRLLEIQISEASKDRTKLRVELEKHTATHIAGARNALQEGHKSYTSVRDKIAALHDRVNSTVNDMNSRTILEVKTFEARLQTSMDAQQKLLTKQTDSSLADMETRITNKQKELTESETRISSFSNLPIFLKTELNGLRDKQKENFENLTSMILKTSNECATNLSSSISRLGDFDTIHEQLRLVNKYHCDNDDSITRIDDSLTYLNDLTDDHKEYHANRK